MGQWQESGRQEPGLRTSLVAERGPWPTAPVLQPLLQPEWDTVVRHGIK